jgi:hypothetical protein
MIPIKIWTHYFLLEQGYRVVENLLLQDSKSLILLERNGKASSSKRMRHINIRYFFITDQVNMKEVAIEWCPTKKMVADFLTRPLQGSHFRNLRDYIMGKVRNAKPNNDATKTVSRTSSKLRNKSKMTGKRRVKLVAQDNKSLHHRSVLGFISK